MEDQSGIDSPPVPLSRSNVEEMIERWNPLFAAKPAPLCSDIPEWLQDFRKKLVDDEIPVQGDSHMPVFFHEGSIEPTPKRSEGLGKHSVYTHFPKDRNCEICQRTKITTAPCRRRNGGAVPRAENFGDLIRADHKSSQWNLWISKQSSICNRGAGLGHPMDPGISVQYQNFTRNPEKLAKVPGTREETKSHVHWQFLRIRQSLWRSLLESLHVYTTQIRNKWECERAVRRVKESTSAVSLQSCLDENWWHGMLYLSAKCYRSLHWRENPRWETFWATIQRTDYSIWFTGWVLPYNCEGPVKNPSIRKESITWIVPRIRIVRGVNSEGWRTGCRHWRVGNDGRIRNLLKKRLNAKEVIFHKESEFTFPIADGRIKLLGGDRDLRTSTLIRHRPIRGESHVDFLAASEGSLPPPQDSLPDANEARSDFWSMSGNFVYRHHVEPRVKLYSPRKESFPIPLKYIDVSRTTHTNLDVKQERGIDDYWTTDGSRDLQVSLSSLHKVRNLQMDICGPGRDWQNGKRHPGQII